ncbi:MAG TPA: hypothetical protein VF505_07145 [Thermoanaerobaculia bacterium]
MTSRRLLAALVLMIASTASADTIGFELFGAWTDPIANGNIRRLDATLRLAPRVRGGAGLSVFLGRGIALSVTDSRGTIPVTLRANGGEPGRSHLSLEYRDAILRKVYGQSDLRGYAGLGITLPAVRELREVSSGGLTLFRAGTPDHAALIINTGADYRMLPHVHLFADLKYEPYASTVEVRRVNFPLDDLEASVHLLVLASGVSFRF